MTEPLLQVEDLHTHFDTNAGVVHAVDGVSFDVHRGEIVGLIGESGCGKSATAQSIVRLESPGRIVSGWIDVDGLDLTTADEAALRRVRGNDVSVVFQDHGGSLNPVVPVGEQIAEAVRVHENDGGQRLFDFLGLPGVRDRSAWASAHDRAIELMDGLGIPQPGQRAENYPHEFSGGMRQRVLLAMALASDPSLLIADEPTTALDTTTQAGLLQQFRALRDERALGILLITHDLGVAAQTCDRVVVMYSGQVMEVGPVETVLTAPEHPYTRALLDCSTGTRRAHGQTRPHDSDFPELVGGHEGCPFIDRCQYASTACRDDRISPTRLETGHRVACIEAPLTDADTNRESGHRERPPTTGDEPRSTSVAPEEAVVELQSVSKGFTRRRSFLDRLRRSSSTANVVRDVSLRVCAGQTVAVVGESGCGKSTLARLVTGQHTPDTGTVSLDSDPVGGYAERSPTKRRQLGIVFQEVQESFDPRWSVGRSIEEALDTDTSSDDNTRRSFSVEELLDAVGLPSGVSSRLPGELSGGQLQRVAIARALAHSPDVVVLDEPVSSLDVATQAAILDLLAEVQRTFGVGYLLISHDLSVVKHLADRLAVMYAGEIVEEGPVNELFESPQHPYTEALLRAIPSDNPRDGFPEPLCGDPPDPTERPSGCSFHPRCPAATTECTEREPDFETIDGSRVRCLHAPDATNETSDDDRTRSK